MKKNIQKFHLVKAYSLIEVLLSLTILSILCVISLPSLLNFYDRKADERLLSQLLHTLSFAHHEALIHGKRVGICQSKNRQHCTDGDWQDGYIVFLDLYGDGSVRNKEQCLAVRPGFKLRGRLYYRAYPFYRTYLLFTSTGRIKNDNGSFWYCPQKNTAPVWAIFLTRSAKIRVAYPNQQGEIKDAQGEVLTCQH